MITFKTLEIENFQALSRVAINLEGQHFTLISGANAEGKTTIIDALLWCLFGETGKGIKADGVLPRHDPRGTKVKVTWIEEGVTYEAIRYRNNDECAKESSKSGVFLFINGKQFSAKTDTQVTSQIEELLGSDFKTFVHTIVFGQHTERFPLISDGEKQKIWDTILDTGWLALMLKAAKEQREEAKEQFSKLEGTIERLKYDKKSTETEFKLFDTKHKNRVADIEQQIADIKDKIRNCDGSTENQHRLLTNFKVTLAELQQKLKDPPDMERYDTSLKKGNEALYRLQGKISEKANKIQSSISKYGERKNKIVLKLKSIANLKAECDKCEQPITPAQSAKLKAKYELELEEVNKILIKLNSNLTKLNKLHQQKRNEIKLKLSKIELARERANAKLKQIEAVKSEIRDTNNKITSATTKISTNRTLKKAFEEQIAKLDSHIEVDTESSQAIKDRLDIIKRDLIDAEVRLESTRRQYQMLDYWVEACGTKGIRAHLVAQVMPILNSMAEHYSEIISGNKVQCNFVSKRQLANGEWRFGFFEKVWNDKGVTEYKELSGGERRQTDLIISMSFHDLIASRASKNFNIMFIDEAFDALDEDNTTSVINLLSDISKNNRSVFVITHMKHLKPYFQNEVKIKGGIAHV